MLECHPPLSKTPRFVALVIEREQLPGVNKPVRGRRLKTHIGVTFEVCDVPADPLGDFLDQLTFGHRFCFGLVVLGRELSTYLLTAAEFRTFALYAPALTSPLDFHSPWPVSSVSSRRRYWKGTPETGDRRWVVASEPAASGTYMYSDCYPAFFIKRGSIPVIHSLEIFFRCIG